MPDNDTPQKRENDPPAEPQQPYAIIRLWRRAWLDRPLLAIAAIGGSLLTGLGLVAHYEVAQNSYRIAFMAQNALNLLIFIAVLVQARIYKAQSGIMEETLTDAKDQSRIAREVLRVSSQARLAVSVDLNLDTDRLFVTIRNIGKLTADDIILEAYLSVADVWEPTSKPIARRYQTLFPGEHETIKIRVALTDLLTPEQVGWIKSGTAKATFYGKVSCSDAFLPKDTYTTSFGFRYRLGDKQWFVRPVEGDDDE